MGFFSKGEPQDEELRENFEAEVRELGELGETEPEAERENVLKLTRPIVLHGKGEVIELEYDFDALTAADLHRISKDLKNKGISITVPALDYEFQLSTFAKAVARVRNDVFLSDILTMSGGDAMRAVSKARDFLLAADPTSKELGFGD